jgi:hypothetical protein
MQILKLTETRYAVITETVLADGSFKADYGMALEGSVLRSINERGFIRAGGNICVHLGPVSLAKVQALRVDEGISL